MPSNDGVVPNRQRFRIAMRLDAHAVAIPIASHHRTQHQDWHGHSEEEDCCAGASSGELNGGGNGNGPCRLFSWRKHELEGLPASTSHGGGELVLVAADVIYDEGLTDAFFHALRMLMPIPASPMPPVRKNEHELAGDHGKDAASPPRDCVTLVDQTPSNPSANTKSVGAEAAAAHSSGDVSTSKEHVVFGAEGGQGQAVLYLALEKRFNFSMAELSVAATGYSALLRNVLDTTPEAHSGGARVDGRKQQGRNAQKDFEGRRLPLSFQQCFHYRRNDAMELWEIRRRPRVGLET